MRKVTRAVRILAAVAAVALHAVASPGVSAAGAYTVAISDATVTEADTANFTVTLNESVQPGDVLTVEVETASGSATVGTCPGDDAQDDFDTPLVFTGGERTKVVSVQTCDDTVVEPTETFSMISTRLRPSAAIRREPAPWRSRTLKAQARDQRRRRAR